MRCASLDVYRSSTKLTSTVVLSFKRFANSRAAWAIGPSWPDSVTGRPTMIERYPHSACPARILVMASASLLTSIVPIPVAIVPVGSEIAKPIRRLP